MNTIPGLGEASATPLAAVGPAPTAPALNVPAPSAPAPTAPDPNLNSIPAHPYGARRHGKEI